MNLIHLVFSKLHYNFPHRLLSVLLLTGFIYSCNDAVKESTAQIQAQNEAINYEANPEWPDRFNIGRPASPERIAAWDIDVRPDGLGLPPGKGTALEGSKIYAQKCAVCHGATGEEGPEDRLVGRVPEDGFPFSENLDSFVYKTIGGYWPYATTLYDYINRSMPQTAPGSLTAEEVYALTAFLLHKNEIISEEAEMNSTTLPQVKMPAHDRFIPDDRLDFKVVH